MNILAKHPPSNRVLAYSVSRAKKAAVEKPVVHPFPAISPLDDLPPTHCYVICQMADGFKRAFFNGKTFYGLDEHLLYAPEDIDSWKYCLNGVEYAVT